MVNRRKKKDKSRNQRIRKWTTEREKSLRPKISQGKEYCSKVKRKDVFLSGSKASPPLGQEAEIEKSNRPGRALWAASGRGGG